MVKPVVQTAVVAAADLSETKSKILDTAFQRLALLRAMLPDFLPQDAFSRPRAYVLVQNIARNNPVVQTLGFVPLPDSNVNLDGRIYLTAMLDFGPSSLDGWRARLLAAELGASSSDILDVEARELVIDDTRVRLTKLEFSVLHYLREREGKAVAREALIRDVWGHKYVGSNVVDAVIKTLRKKLGKQSDMIETVAGHGYKFRSAR
jgi:hypothetical protein